MTKKKSSNNVARHGRKSEALPAAVAKHDLNHAGRRVVWALVMALFLGLVLGSVAAAWWLHDETDSSQQLAQYEYELLISQGNLIQVQAQLDSIQANSAVEASTRKALEATLLENQDELGRVRDQLAFFNELLPPGPKGAVSIRALDIKPVGPNLEYRALLMRSGAAGAPFKGLMQFMAKGLQDGKAAKIELYPVQASVADDAASPEAAGFPLDFDQFQRSGGLLSLPPGFIAQAVTLNILEGSTVRVSRTVNLAAPE